MARVELRAREDMSKGKQGGGVAGVCFFANARPGTLEYGTYSGVISGQKDQLPSTQGLV